ncbi:hypothetical protein KAU93_00885 [Candidatus Bathyarchaeota archaeon]|nr:hypothetical protein [Candidatus Bathyarchaeota archaeon]
MKHKSEMTTARDEIIRTLQSFLSSPPTTMELAAYKAIVIAITFTIKMGL